MGILSIFGNTGFGSFILDSYAHDEKAVLAESINDICSPFDSFSWASTGIYCFWDYYSHEILYIGKSIDLSERFRQHNGIAFPHEGGTKREEIGRYFENNPRLGYSIFVQSSLSQSSNRRNYKSYPFTDVNRCIDVDSCESISAIEGNFLIECHNLTGSYPIWNHMGGKVYKYDKKYINIYKELLNHLSGRVMDDFISRSSIRELSSNSSYLCYELELHAIRMLMFRSGISFNGAVEELSGLSNQFSWVYNQIIVSKYFDKQLIL